MFFKKWPRLVEPASSTMQTALRLTIWYTPRKTDFIVYVWLQHVVPQILCVWCVCCRWTLIYNSSIPKIQLLYVRWICVYKCMRYRFLVYICVYSYAIARRVVYNLQIRIYGASFHYVYIGIGMIPSPQLSILHYRHTDMYYTKIYAIYAICVPVCAYLHILSTYITILYLICADWIFTSTTTTINGYTHARTHTHTIRVGYMENTVDVLAYTAFQNGVYTQNH